MTSSIKSYWASLESRERMILGWGSVIVVLILLYSLLWKPWSHAIGFMEKSARQMRVDSVWMEQRAKTLKGGITHQAKRVRGQDQSLLSVIEQTAKQARVREAIRQIVPNQTTNDVRVVLEGVDFNQWVRWVDNLYKNYGVDITSVSAEKEDEKPNIAEIRVTFVRL